MLASLSGSLAAVARRTLRHWARRPWPVVVAVISIALGITAVTVVFAVMDATLFRAIPGTHAPELMRVQGAGGSEPLLVVSYPEFEAIQASGAFPLAAAERVNGAVVGVGGSPRPVGLAAVTRDYFRTLGVRFTRGTGFDAGEGEAAAVVSEAFWRSHLGGDPGALGRVLHIRDRAYPVVGIVGDGFQGAFPAFRVAVWVPLEEVTHALPGDGDPSQVDDRFLNVLVQAPVSGEGTLDDRLDAVAAGLAANHDLPAGRTFRVASARGTHPSLKPIAQVLTTLMLVVAGMVLVVACGNVANLLLAQGVARRAEVAVMVSLGCPPLRLVRRFLGESLLLGLVGSGAGLVLTAVALRSLSLIQPPVDVPLGLHLAMDARVAGFASGLGALSGVVFGLWPAVRSARRSPVVDLRAGTGGGGGGPSGSWPQRALVVLQVVATTVLLTGAVLMVRGLHGIDGMDPGFRREGVVTVEAELRGLDPARVDMYWTRARLIAEATPDVEGTALGLFVHLGGRSDQRRVGPAGTPEAEWPTDPVNYSRIEGDLLGLLEVPLEEGRTVGGEGEGAAEAVVNRVLADRLWPDGSPLGRILAVRDPDGSVRTAEVVGVTATVRYRRLNEGPTPFLYLPLEDVVRGESVLHVRTEVGREDDVVRALRDRLRDVDPGVPATVRPMTDHTTVAEVVAQMLRALLLYTGAAATLISVAGVFGVMSFLSARRRPELALRLALGASPGGVRRLVVGDLMRFVAAGVAVGLLLGRMAGGRLSGLLFAVGAGDPVTFAIVPLVVLAAAVAGAWIPAARATRGGAGLMATLGE